MNKPSNLISGVIITFNEEKNIERCINSLLPVVDEVLVVDSFSQDQTVAIAKKLGAVVIEQEFLGHIQQKNFAKNKASHQWILSLDADECLSRELEESILGIKPIINNYDAYHFNRFTNYCGTWIRHCGWYPDVKLRLFQKHLGAWGGRNPHDRFIVPDPSRVLHLKGDLLHYSFYKIEEHLSQIEKFAAIGAQAYYEKGIRANTLNLIINPAFKFIRNYILKLGLLDGRAGWRICTLSAYATYLKYSKLKNIQKLNRVSIKQN